MAKKINEKHLSAFLIFLGVAALLLGVVAIRSTISSSIVRPQQGSSNIRDSLSQETELRNKDTDKDGLSDYEEINLYQTSPYLEDSDSDGILDREEVISGADPTCPAGQNCFAATQPLAESTTQDLGELNPTPIGPLSGSLRESLRQAGLEDEILSALSDEELLSVYEEVTGTAPPTSGSEPLGVLPPSGLLLGEPTDYLKNMSAGDLRDLLMEAGIPEEFLADIDDTTLKRMFLESL